MKILSLPNQLLAERMTSKVLATIAINIAAQMSLNERSSVTARAVLDRAVRELTLSRDPAFYGIVDEAGIEPDEAFATAMIGLGQLIEAILTAAKTAAKTRSKPKLQ